MDDSFEATLDQLMERPGVIGILATDIHGYELGSRGTLANDPEFRPGAVHAVIEAAAQQQALLAEAAAAEAAEAVEGASGGEGAASDADSDFAEVPPPCARIVFGNRKVLISHIDAITTAIEVANEEPASSPMPGET